MDGHEELMPGLPEDLALECLIRVHYSAHRLSSRICKRWRHLLQSKGFYSLRKQAGFTHKAACLIQALPARSDSKPAGQPRYGISLFDPMTLSWGRIDPPLKYADGLPLFCQVASTEGKLILMGGMDPSSWEPVRDVFVHEFTTQKWTKSADMPSTRLFFAMGAIDGKVLVAGGHDESKNALSTAWVLDMKRNEWSELSRMGEERDECEGVVIGSEFWVVSGYATETQGEFKSSAEVYDVAGGLGSGWRRVEDAWQANRSPRSCVGRNGNTLICWTAEAESGARVGECGVELLGAGPGRAVVTGSAYQGALHGFYFYREEGGGNSKLVKINVGVEYSGMVQSGCCVEI